MESNTTLFTFLYESPPAVRTVELLGSWDNFSRPYQMERDRRRGSRHWVGCYRFAEIICDGTDNQLVRSRSGGLKMGGRYWFYYRLDGHIEAVADTIPSTTTCPLLPGQPLNVMDVPTDSPPLVPEDASLPSADVPAALTMDPKARYLRPQPAPSSQIAPAQALPSLVTSSSTTVEPVPGGLISPASLDEPSHPTTATTTASLDSSAATMRTRGLRSKSTSASPAAALRSALHHLKGSKLSVSDDQDGSNHSSQHDAQDMEISSPVLVSRTDQGRHCIPLVQEASSTTSHTPTMQPRSALHSQPPPFSPLRAHPVTPNDEHIVAQSKLEVARASLEELRVKGREVCNVPAEASPSATLQRTRTPSPLRLGNQPAPAPPSTRPRSSSLSLRSRDPSPLRNAIVGTEATHVAAAHVPEEIVEADNEGDTAVNGWEAEDHHQEANPSPEAGILTLLDASSNEHLNKELPALPPDVTLLRSCLSTHPRGGVMASNEPGSHFSIWSNDTMSTATTFESLGSPVSPTSPISPTFSSTATASSLDTPHRLSMYSDYEPSDEFQSISADPDVGASTATLTSTRSLSQPKIFNPLIADPNLRRQGICFDTPTPQEIPNPLEAPNPFEAPNPVQAYDPLEPPNPFEALSPFSYSLSNNTSGETGYGEAARGGSGCRKLPVKTFGGGVTGVKTMDQLADEFAYLGEAM